MAALGFPRGYRIQCRSWTWQIPNTEANMTVRIFLTLGLMLLHLSEARADKFPSGPPQPKLFASDYGTFAFKILPDASSVKTRARAEGSHSPAQAGQIVGNSEGVFFTLDENGNEKEIWRAKLANVPNRAILVESGKHVLTLDSWHSIGFDHCLVVYGETGKVIADFKLEDLLTAEEIAGLPGSITHRGWSDKDIAEFEDRSREDELAVRIKYKDWAKVIRLSLSTGRILEGAPAGAVISGLSAELRNVAVRADNSIDVDFVLHNHSEANIVLAERWNSWGAYQWEFRVVDAKGGEFMLCNPQRDWYRNAFTTFTIPPSKEHVTRCRLDRTAWKFEDGPVAVFSEVHIGADDKRRQNNWAFPLSITGTFFAARDNLNVFGEKGSNWAGTIATNTVQAGESSWSDSRGDHGAIQPKKSSGGEPVLQLH